MPRRVERRFLEPRPDIGIHLKKMEKFGSHIITKAVDTKKNSTNFDLSVTFQAGLQHPKLPRFCSELPWPQSNKAAARTPQMPQKPWTGPGGKPHGRCFKFGFAKVVQVIILLPNNPSKNKFKKKWRNIVKKKHNITPKKTPNPLEKYGKVIKCHPQVTGVHRVIDLQLHQEHGGGLVDDAPDEARHEGAAAFHGAAARGDGDQARQDAVAQAAHVVPFERFRRWRKDGSFGWKIANSWRSTPSAAGVFFANCHKLREEFQNHPSKCR